MASSPTPTSSSGSTTSGAAPDLFFPVRTGQKKRATARAGRVPPSCTLFFVSKRGSLKNLFLAGVGARSAHRREPAQHDRGVERVRREIPHDAHGYHNQYVAITNMPP